MHCIYKKEKEIEKEIEIEIEIEIPVFTWHRDFYCAFYRYFKKKDIHIFMVYSFCLVYFLDFQKKGILFCSFMNKSYNILLNLC